MPQQYRDASERNRSSSWYEDEEEEYYDDDEEYYDEEEEEEEEQETTESDDDDEEQEASFSPRDLDQQEEASGQSSDLRQSQTTTTFNDIEHSLLAPLYDHDRRPLEGFTTEEVPESWSEPAQKNHDVVSKSAASPHGNSSYNSPGSRASTLPPPSPALSPSTPNKRTKINRKIITKRIVGGVPQTVSVVKNGVPKHHQQLQSDFDASQQGPPKIMGLHDVPRASTTTMKPSAQPSPSLSKSKNVINVPKNKNQPQKKKKKKIVVVKKKNGSSSLVSEAEKQLRQRQEEECFAPLLNVKPPAGNRESFSTFLPTKFALLLVLGVVGAVAYSVFTLVIGASSFEEHASLESCNQLTPTTGVRAVPYRMIVLASVTSVLFPIIINLIKYRARQNQLEREEKKQKYELEQSLLQKQSRNKRRPSTRLVTRTRIVERVRLVPVYGRNEDDDDEEEMEGEEEEAYEEEEEYEEEIACEDEEEEEEAENEDTADQRSLTNSSFRSEETRQQDEVETFSLTSERVPFLTSIKRQSYRELGWIFQTYATIDGRWYLLILIFALANFFFNIVQVSSVERDSTFKDSNIWDRYQSMYMRWFQSGTVSVLGVFFSQFLTSFICSEIAGMPTEVHDDEFLKKKLDLLKRQQMESADQELILGARQMASSTAGVGKKKNSKNSKSASASGSSGSVSAEEFEEMKTKKKFSTSAASLLENVDTTTNTGNSHGFDDASREREEAIKLKDMRSLSRVIGNIPLPFATLLVSTSPENAETLTFTHLFFGGLLLYPGMITHVIPSFVVFLPMSILFSIPLLLCYLITKYELRPFAALVERENGKEALCRRHRSSVICMIIVSRIISVFVLTAMFQTLMCYSTMFFVRGRASYGDTIVNEVQYRDVDCFLWAVNHESVYQWSVAGLIFS